jgi:hypothetical protein
MDPVPALRCLPLLLSLVSTARGGDIGPALAPETLLVDGQLLQLNGAGLRTRFFAEVYLGALYLPRRSGDARAILATDQPWAVTLAFRRDVGHEAILEAFVEAFEHNSPGQVERLKPQLEVFHAVLQDLKRGDTMRLAYLPGAGTTLTVPGGATATVTGRAFGEAVLRTWLGEHPADARLKEALLGLETR